MKEALHHRYTGYYTGRVLWHKDRDWGDLQFSSSSSSLKSGAEGGAFRKNHKLYVTVGGGTARTIVNTDGAPRYEGRDVVGHVSFIPAERQNQGWYKGDILECLSLEIPPNWIAKCLDRRELATVEFFPTTNQFDPLLFNVMSALRQETEHPGPVGRLFAETAATLIALHLVRCYSSAGHSPVVSERQCMATADLERTIEFVEENLGTDLPLGALAGIANMPVSTFVRGFRQATSMSPHKYLLQRRIYRARQLLGSPHIPIAEIAYRLGFSSQSHFSTVFRAWVGESPGRFRRQVRD
jgi:AraC family transcriptional regulator